MFTVIELQTNNGVTSALTNAYSDESVACQKYHQILSFAAVSNVDIHTAIILNESGNTLKCESFAHNTNNSED